jgi:hypothetical protein
MVTDAEEAKTNALALTGVVVMEFCTPSQIDPIRIVLPPGTMYTAAPADAIVVPVQIVKRAVFSPADIRLEDTTIINGVRPISSGWTVPDTPIVPETVTVTVTEAVGGFNTQICAPVPVVVLVVARFRLETEMVPVVIDAATVPETDTVPVRSAPTVETVPITPETDTVPVRSAPTVETVLMIAPCFSATI